MLDDVLSEARALSPEDRCHLRNELIVDLYYNELEQRIQAHYLDLEAWDAIKNMKTLRDNDETAHDYLNAKRMQRGVAA